MIDDEDYIKLHPGHVVLLFSCMFTSLPVCIGVYFLGFLDSRLSFMVKLGLLTDTQFTCDYSGQDWYNQVSYLHYA